MCVLLLFFKEDNVHRTFAIMLNVGAYKSALIAALPFLLRGATIEERSNRKGHFSSVAALLLRRLVVEKGEPQKKRIIFFIAAFLLRPRNF